jgi:hypothetical protein
MASTSIPLAKTLQLDGRVSNPSRGISYCLKTDNTIWDITDAINQSITCYDGHPYSPTKLSSHWLSYGAAHLVTATFVQGLISVKKNRIFYPSYRNAPFYGSYTFTRGILFPIKSG